MGIPYFFSYIIKNHKNIVNKFKKQTNIKYDNFFLDSNSIIYDIVQTNDVKKYNEESMQSMRSMNDIQYFIIEKVIEKIEYYISLINPSGCVFIAFDGTPPLSKLEQQRSRRYKSWYSNKIKKNIDDIFNENKENKEKNNFDTIHITSGTEFMNNLSSRMKNYFYSVDYIKNKNYKKIIFSGSDESGEGESKIFEYIRDNKLLFTNNNKNVIFGLDSDLIILSLNHIYLNNRYINISLFRESSFFNNSSINDNNEKKEDDIYLLNINELSKYILIELNKNIHLKDKNYSMKRIKDYIFLSFLLGNDFIHGHVSLNIRLNGFDKILNIYKNTIMTKKDIYLIENDKIQWNNVSILFSFLEKEEQKNIISVYEKRNINEVSLKKINNITTLTTLRKYKTPEKMYEKFELIPNYKREIEKFIDPYKKDWQNRYYQSLFDITTLTKCRKYETNEITTNYKKEICINYLEALEWIFKYYTDKCPNYYWKYNYNYSPLLEDILKYIPLNNEFEFITRMNEVSSKYKKNNNTIKPITQLLYVLPQENMKQLYPEIYEKIIEKYPNYYTDNIEFIWAFKKYFWECSPKLPNIDINNLENFITE
jgi:5'-3' exoribonuclease 2